jgi:hypothetical protein
MRLRYIIFKIGGDKMKKYGQADVMCVLVHFFLSKQNKLTEDQKKKIESRSCAQINDQYLTAVQWEVER